MKVEILAGPEDVAAAAARWIVREAQAAVAARGRFTLALSGGRTPWRMTELLAASPVPWHATHLLQVDERVAPRGDPDRNLTGLERTLLSRIALPPGNLHAMPVEPPDLEAAARAYAGELARATAGTGVLDVVHLGLGADGHAASLVPGDPVLGVAGADVAVTAPYGGRRRMTLTYPVLDRARTILWVVTGAGKAEMLARLVAGDGDIPAGRVRADRATVIADAAAAPGRSPGSGGGTA